MNVATILPDVPQWVCWRVEQRKGKDTKPPIIPGTNRYASVDDPATWRSYSDAVAGMNGHAGVGFVFCAETGITGVDIDHCVDANGQIAPYALAIVQGIGSYAERSPNDGIHIFVRGTLPGERNKVGTLEMFDRGKYFTVTGDQISGTPAEIKTADVSCLHRLMTARVFDFARNPKLEALMRGQWEGSYSSQSEADLALCSLLASLGLSESDIDSAFRISGLMREKWERADYREATIGKALTSKPAVGTVELLRTSEGKPRPLMENAISLLRHSPEWQGVLGFDEFSLKYTMCKPAPEFPPDSKPLPREWTDADDARTLCWMQRNGIFINSTNTVATACSTVALENRYHPVRMFLESLRWDGTERISVWMRDYLGAPDKPPFGRAVASRWLISAVARIFQPGCQVDHTLLLEGPQGVGKSTALRVLFGSEWFADSISTLGSKDSRQELHGKWCIEISELSAMRRAEIEAVKSFLSERVDHYRESYGRRAMDFPRQNIFSATTNATCPLADESGNRRFWPVRVGKIRVDELAGVRNQLWAEAVTLYRQGKPWWLDSADLIASAADEQERRYQEGPRDSLILDWITRPCQHEGIERWNGSRQNRISIFDVILHALEVPLHQVKHSDHLEVSRCLKHAGWERRRDGARRGLWYWFDPKIEPFKGAQQ